MSRPTRSRVLLAAVAGLVVVALLALAACQHKEQTENAAPGGGGNAPATTTPATTAAPAAGAAQTAAGPLKVVALGIGKAVGPDGKVTAEVDTFAPHDTFYAAVGTTGGSPGAKLTAKWAAVSRTGADTPISDETKTISPSGDATTEFHVAKPEGWAAGDYKVEILLDGQSVAVKAFRVAK